MPAPYDLNFKILGDDDPRALVALIADLPAGVTIESLDREINVETTRADQLLLVHEPEGKSLIHIEAITRYYSGWSADQIRKAAQIAIKYWLPLRSVALFLTEKGVPKNLASVVPVEFQGFRMQLNVEVIKVWEIPARKALALDSMELCPWAMLMDASPQEQVEAANRVRASGDRDLAIRMAVFAGLRYGKKVEVLERLDQMITWEQLMEESWFLRDMVEQRKNLELAQVLRDANSRTLRRQLTRRFGTLPESVEAAMASATPEQFDLWLDRVIDAKSLDEIFA